MEKYIDVKNIISSICNQSGLSLGEICGVLNGAAQKEQIAKLQAELAQLKEGNKDDSEEESE